VSTENQFSKYDGITSVTILVAAMYALQQRKEKLEEELKELNKEYDFLRITKVPSCMEEEGVQRITVAGIGRVSLTADMHVSVKSEQRERFFEWLRDNGRGDLIQDTVNASTLKAAVKKMFANGEDIPEDLLNVSPFTRASITKA